MNSSYLAPDGDVLKEIRKNLRKIENEAKEKKRDIRAQTKVIRELELELNSQWYRFDRLIINLKSEVAKSEAEVESLKDLHKESRERLHVKLVDLRDKEAELNREISRMRRE